MADKSVIITPSQADIDDVRGYRIGKWGEYKNYQCLDCQYATIFKEKMDKHIAEGEHPWAFPGGAVQTADDSGEPEY